MSSRTGREWRRLAAALGIAAALAFGAAACGDDEEDTPDAAQPAPASPVEETPPAGVEPEPAPEPEPGGDDAGGEPEPVGDSGGVSPPDPEPGDDGGGDEAEGDNDSGGSGGVGPGSAADSPDHDVAPEPGSPASEFEQYCNEHPEACG